MSKYNIYTHTYIYMYIYIYVYIYSKYIYIYTVCIYCSVASTAHPAVVFFNDRNHIGYSNARWDSYRLKVRQIDYTQIR